MFGDLQGQEQAIFADRDRKLDEARRERQQRGGERREAARQARYYTTDAWAEDRAAKAVASKDTGDAAASINPGSRVVAQPLRPLV